MADRGYDVAHPRDVEPVFGDPDEFDALLADAHALGLRVTVGAGLPVGRRCPRAGPG